MSYQTEPISTCAAVHAEPEGYTPPPSLFNRVEGVGGGGWFPPESRCNSAHLDGTRRWSRPRKNWRREHEPKVCAVVRRLEMWS